MKKKTQLPNEAVSLRQKAEELFELRNVAHGGRSNEGDQLKLLHELEVHQIELEMQQEELQLAKQKAENAAEKYSNLYDFAPFGYFTLDTEGAICGLNLSGANMLCKERGTLMNTSFRFFVTKETRRNFNDFFSKVWANHTKEACEVQLFIQDRPTVFVHIEGVVEENKKECFLTVIDITERKKATQEQARLLKLGDNQNNRLQNFAHIVSHNLRSHSSNISGLINILLEDYPDFVHDNIYFQYLQKASDNLMESIKHLSDVAQLHTNEQTQLTAIKLNEIVEKAISNVVALAKNANVEIINDLRGHEMVLGEVTYLDSIVLNVLTNAIKYRSKDRNSYVKISSSIKDHYLILSIEDNGLGIDLVHNKDKLFGMFKTFHNHPDARGVGLFITKNQIEALGGTIELESEENKGSTFKIYFQNSTT